MVNYDFINLNYLRFTLQSNTSRPCLLLDLREHEGGKMH